MWALMATTPGGPAVSLCLTKVTVSYTFRKALVSSWVDKGSAWTDEACGQDWLCGVCRGADLTDRKQEQGQGLSPVGLEQKLKQREKR